ncbi:whey acidic protein-like [Pungitius pungitius]|uniref:whey acidic protein-like n=1 Tax=Pungitius pungitius TaxID=134920 RepID=UPI002E11C255
MEQHWLTVCALILAFSAFMHHGIAFTAKGKAKPGVCPYGQFGTCRGICYTDSDCPNDEKCCPNECGHECIAPYKVKPGICPAPDGITVCAFLCYHDGQCPGHQKCCVTSCGFDCRDLLFERSNMEQHWLTLCALILALGAFMHHGIAFTAEADAKPGVCSHIQIEPCGEFCSTDWNCPDDMKCCSNGCGHVCTAPYKAKPGRCPYGQFGTCRGICYTDSDCPDDEKCCPNECGHECIAPYKVKPGLCPAPDGITVCAFLCHHDGQCPRDQKCCKTSCGFDCRDPLFEN